MGTQAQQVWTWVGTHLWQIIMFGSLFIQIAPIKINPWSTIIKWIGKILMGEACGKMDDLIEKIDDMDTEMKENEKDRIRWEILDFANSCHNHRKHTRDEFKHIIELNDKYNTLLEQTHDRNGVFKAEYEYIKKLYDKLNEKDAFLAQGDDTDE